MSNRLDTERQKHLEPGRVAFAVGAIEKLGYNVSVDMAKITFQFKGHLVTLWCYSGWHTGKTIRDGRGLQNLLKQLKP